MVPRPNRIPASDIPHVTRFGSRVFNDFFQLIVARNTTGICRFSFIVSTKIDKRAVKRNRMRRLLSESIQTYMNDIEDGFDCVFMVKKPFSDKRIDEISALVRILLQKARVIPSV